MFKNMKIGTRLALGFGFVLLMLIIIGIAGFWGVNSISSNTINMLKGDAQVSEHASRARANTLGLRRYEKDLFINIGDKAKEDDYQKKWKERGSPWRQDQGHGKQPLERRHRCTRQIKEHGMCGPGR
jgi:methyl-accepting chemotaxis protein